MNRLIAVILALLALVPAYAGQTEPIFVNSTKDEAGWLDFKRRFLDGPDGRSLYVDGKFPAAVLGTAACQVAVNQKRLTQAQHAACSEAFMQENGVDPDALLSRKDFETRGRGARYYMPSMVLAQASTAPGGAAANGNGAMPVSAAAPAAPAPDPAALAEMKRQLAAITAARQTEAAAATASANALSGRIDGVGQQATAAARAASAAQEAAQRVGRKADTAERVANAASGVASEAKAQARGAAASAAGASVDAAKARSDAASAAGLAAVSWSKALEVEKTLEKLTVTVNQIDWRPFAAVLALAAIGGLAMVLLRRKVNNLETVATAAKAKAEAAMTELGGVRASVAGNTSDIVDLRADVRGVRDVVEGQPGFTQLAEGTAMFYQRLTLLGPDTHPTMTCEVLVTNEDGIKQSLNINITAVGNDRYTVEGIRDQGDNALAFEGLDKKILRAGRQGRIVGCKPFVPPAGSPSNGPKTQPDTAVAGLEPVVLRPLRRAGRTQLSAPALPDPVPAFLQKPPGDAQVAVGGDTESTPLPTVQGELLPGVPPRPLASPLDFNADRMIAVPDQSAANTTPPTATGTVGS